MIHTHFKTALLCSLLTFAMSCGEPTNATSQETPDDGASIDAATPSDNPLPAAELQPEPTPPSRSGSGDVIVARPLANAAANITDQPLPAGSAEWLPGAAARWTLEWSSEFNGDAGDETHPNVTRWYPMLGWTPEDFKTQSDKGLRWTGNTDDSAWFYSTKTGNHWLDGQGNLILRAVVDKTAPPNDHGPRVKTAYLQTGYPAKWNPDPDAEHQVVWEPGDGVFVSPTVDGQVQPLYIAARLRADQVHGWSTWFAFWAFSHTRSYNNLPADGTEIDILEVVAGNNPHFNNFINIANHWFPQGNVKEDKYFNQHTDPKASAFLTLADGNYHTYGLEWSDQSMKLTIDGKPLYTFTQNIPVDPVDMMLLLTLEFKPNLWIANTGDGRTEGPYVSDTPELREMSRVQVDYVRVYRKQAPQP